MKISTILDHKQSEVITIDIFSTLKTAAELMSQRHIAALVVMENGVAAGLISERDIVEAFAIHGRFADEMRVRQVINRQVPAVSPDDTIKRAMSIMTYARIRHLPVMEEGELLGIVSLGDVVKYRLEELELEAGVLRDISVAVR